MLQKQVNGTPGLHGTQYEQQMVHLFFGKSVIVDMLGTLLETVTKKTDTNTQIFLQ